MSAAAEPADLSPPSVGADEDSARLVSGDSD